MDKMVSIVLPVHNGEQFLEDSIKSVINQTYTNWELIIVNDCSTDNSESIITQYQSTDSRIRYVKNETNLKLPRSLNVGFELAKGEYLTWTSDDNLFRPHALETMVGYLEAHPDVAMVYADCNSIDETGATIGYFEAGSSDELLYRNVVGACFLYRSKVKQELGGYDPSLFLVEDLEYWMRIHLHNKIVPLNKCLYDYRYHINNLTATRKQEIYRAKCQLMWLYLEKYEATGMPEEKLFPYFTYILRYKDTVKERRIAQMKFGMRHKRYFWMMISNGLKSVRSRRM